MRPSPPRRRRPHKLKIYQLSIVMLPNWTYRAESSWDVRDAGRLGLVASSALGVLPRDLARPAWPNLVSTGSIWLPWASWPARFGCPGCSRALWLARSGYQRKPQRLAFRLPASFVPVRSVCIVSSCVDSSTFYINYWDLTLPSFESR